MLLNYPQAAGRTTILKLINGLLKPDEGHISIRGTPCDDWNSRGQAKEKLWVM